MDWDTNEDGTIKLCPLMSFETAVIPLGGAVRVRYADSLKDIDYGRPQCAQLHMSETQAREFGLALLQMADTIGGHAEGKG